MNSSRLQKETVLRVGEVSAVTGRRVFVDVDQNKNLSELFFDGDIIKNIAVGSYIDIRKGFLSLIGKVEGENANSGDGSSRAFLLPQSEEKRILVVSLVGFIDPTGQFCGGTKELPLVGNEAFLLTRKRVHQIHSLVAQDGIALNIAKSEYEGYDIALPVDGLMNSHIAIFGNTGSGKSNTLAILYQDFIAELQARNQEQFEENCQIVLFDFNGEYTRASCLTEQKAVYKLSTINDAGDKLPLGQDALLDLEILSILGAATEKTQRPFLSRTLTLQKKILSADDPEDFLRNTIRNQIKRTIQSAEKAKGELLYDYLSQILPETNSDGVEEHICADLQFHTGVETYKRRSDGLFLDSHIDQIPETIAYKRVDQLSFSGDVLTDFIMFMYVRLIYDVLDDRAQNEHIAPVIHRLKSKQNDISKLFDTDNNAVGFNRNVVIISLNDVNTEMKKTVPLLISKKVYQVHKKTGDGKTLNIVIDEAHNILSNVSFRESESWKDYRLETFEEIIKEGRKFGVFVTIASQRPSDISPTITSQAHNYFIHRLVNDRDLKAISTAVSYIDKITEESIPTLPIGTCIFSGMAGQMPLKLAIHELDEELRPHSATRKFSDIVEVDIFSL